MTAIKVRMHLEFDVRRTIHPDATITPDEIKKALDQVHEGLILKLVEGVVLKDSRVEINPMI